MVDGFSKKGSSDMGELQWSGRTTTNRIVNFQADFGDSLSWQPIPGELLDIKIEKAFHHSLWGTPIVGKDTPSEMKGATYHAV
jgi:tRNA A37 methylthiotransferase MiaB